LRAENRILRKVKTSEGIVSIFNNLTRWGGAVLIVRYVYLMVLALAGHATFADIGLKILGDVKVSETVAWLFGSGSVAYGWHQRKLRKDTVERLQERIQKFERQIDGKRTSSRLTARGNTRPEDER
jgi:hypothetical protein